MIAARQFFRRFPATIGLASLVAIIGIAAETHVDRLAPELMQRFGFAPLHLVRGDLLRLLTSVVLTVGGWSFYLSWLMLVGCVGGAEALVGTRRTLATFFGVHLATLLVQSLLLALPGHLLDFPWGRLLATEHDVGPSAGYYGCLGVVCARQPAGRRVRACAAVFLILLARLAWRLAVPQEVWTPLGADVAHLLAFPLGLVCARGMAAPSETALSASRR